MSVASVKLLGGVVLICGVAGAAMMGSARRVETLTPNMKDSVGATVLPTTHRIDPAGRHIELTGDLPVRMKLSPDSSQLLVVTAGFHNHSLSAIDLSTEKVSSTKSFVKVTAGLIADSKGFLIGRANDGIAQFDSMSDTPRMLTGKLPAKSWIAGLIRTNDGKVLALDQNRDLLAQMDPTSGQITREIPVGHKPMAIVLSEDGKTLAISNEGSGSVSFLAADTLAVTATAKVGVHPNELTFAKDGTLFVTNAGSNTVSVLRDQKVVATVFTSHRPGELVGSTPEALALSPDQGTLYIANADANEVAVIDVVNPGKPKVKGFIPTGWYPSALAVSPDGKKLFVGVGKGLDFKANPQNANAEGRRRYAYIGSLLKGWVSVIDVPDANALGKYTARVDQLARAREDRHPEASQLTAGAFKKIKHVVYVIRENRTYDQVFGDLPGTNADPSNLMFGEQVTPNAHALTKQWVTLDNLYCDGEVSQDGHQWCDAAYATRFNEHAWPAGYAQKGQPDDDDTVNDSPAGYIWDACRKAGRSYISYGEASDFKSTPDSAPIFTGSKGLNGHASADWELKGGRDKDKIDIFINDLKSAEKTGKWPNFMVMSLGEDHTDGARAGSYTPSACVASNDLALGKMVDAITHSKFWAETAIFVIEDDAQNGPDHVDAHRTVGLVISPYTKRGIVDSNLYSTGSMLKTIELMLGLKPMTQHDRGSNAMYSSFMTSPNFGAYNVRQPKIDLNAKNPARTALAEMSKKLNLSGFDRSDPALMNEILWRSVNPGRPMPPVVNGVSR